MPMLLMDVAVSLWLCGFLVQSPNVGLLEHETVAQFHWPSYATRIWLDHRQTVGPGASTVADTSLGTG